MILLDDLDSKKREKQRGVILLDDLDSKKREKQRRRERDIERIKIIIKK